MTLGPPQVMQARNLDHQRRTPPTTSAAGATDADAWQRRPAPPRPARHHQRHRPYPAPRLLLLLLLLLESLQRGIRHACLNIDARLGHHAAGLVRVPARYTPHPPLHPLQPLQQTPVLAAPPGPPHQGQ